MDLCSYNNVVSIQNTVQGIGRELAMELVAETERLLALYDTLPTTNEIIPSSMCAHCDHYVVLLYLQLCRATGDPSPASGPPTQTEAKTTRAEQRSIVIVGVRDMLYVSHPLAEDPGIPQSSSQGGNWPGVSTAVLDRLLVPLEERERMSSGVVTKKSSVAHRAVLTARDAALEVRVAVYLYCHVMWSWCRSLWCVWRRWSCGVRREGKRRGRGSSTGGTTGTIP